MVCTGARHHQKHGRLPGEKRKCTGEAEELETLLLGHSDVAGIITALAENACDRGWKREFWIDREKRRPGDERVKTGKHGELGEVVEQVKTQQNGLVTSMARKNRMMKRVSEEMQNEFFNGCWTWRRNSLNWTASCSRQMGN